MKDYILADEWLIVEDGFDPKNNRVSESIFSIGNGKMGQRANFEETYTGDSLQGTYVAGVYYPDKTRVGWWKNGYPEYFAKVANATNWIGLNIRINGVLLDLAQCKISSFRRELNMKEGYLKREFEAQLINGEFIKVKSTRFCSLAKTSVAALEYEITPLSANSQLEIESYLDGDIKNEDANYDEKFWDEVSQFANSNTCNVITKTRKTNFTVASAAVVKLSKDKVPFEIEFKGKTQTKFASSSTIVSLKQNETLSLCKYVSNISSLDYYPESICSISNGYCR
jgi:maltose phosphorylase